MNIRRSGRHSNRNLNQDDAIISGIPTDDDSMTSSSPPPARPGRGRGRGRGQPSAIRDLKATTTNPVGGRNKTPVVRPGRPKSSVVIQTLSYPVTERDEETVECSKCHESMMFRDFRLHNLDSHYNLAKTTDDDTVLNHQFYERKLRELLKLKKVVTFTCPYCSTTYKSPLGLAYHLEVCGKTEDEINSIKVECNICHEKFLAPHLSQHKKSKHSAPKLCVATKSLGPRPSKVKAKEVLQDLEGEHDENEENLNLKKEGDEWDSSDVRNDSKAQNLDRSGGKRPRNFLKSGPSTKSQISVSKQGIKYNKDGLVTIETIPFGKPENGDPNANVSSAQDEELWDPPVRNFEDPLVSQLATLTAAEQENKLSRLDSATGIRAYLPNKENSLEFKTQTLIPDGSSTFISSKYHRLSRFSGEIVDSVDCNFISFVGASILSMAWHPSGQILAISTMENEDEDPNVLEAKSRHSSLIIYCQMNTSEDCPDTTLCVKLIIGLDYGYINDIRWCNYWPDCVDSVVCKSSKQSGGDKVGYLACAMEDSSVRIFSINSSDFNLAYNFPQNKPRFRVYKKTPEICLNIDSNSKQNTGQCTCLDWHEDSRFLVAGYGSGLLAVFDLGTKSCLLKKTLRNPDKTHVITIHPFWLIKGHVLPVRSVVMDPSNSRYFYSGSMDRYVKAWDMDLGLEIESKLVGLVLDMCWIRGWMHLAVSTDVGVGYGNNNSQLNYVRFFPVGISKGTSNSAEYFNITSISFHEGMTAQATETGKVNVTFYDAFWRECDYERSKRKKNCVIVCNLGLDLDSFTPLPTLVDPKEKNEELYHGSLKPVEEPKLILSFTKDRNDILQLNAEPTPQAIENYVRCHNYLKINKVSWCPRGNLLAVGYKNGMFAIIPASFERLFTLDVHVPKRGRHKKHSDSD